MTRRTYAIMIEWLVVICWDVALNHKDLLPNLYSQEIFSSILFSYRYKSLHVTESELISYCIYSIRELSCNTIFWFPYTIIFTRCFCLKFFRSNKDCVELFISQIWPQSNKLHDLEQYWWKDDYIFHYTTSWNNLCTYK